MKSDSPGRHNYSHLTNVSNREVVATVRLAGPAEPEPEETVTLHGAPRPWSYPTPVERHVSAGIAQLTKAIRQEPREP
jgi:hypothetical protein